MTEETTDVTTEEENAQRTEAPATEQSEENGSNAQPELKKIDYAKRKKKNIWGLVLTAVIFACVVYALWKLGALLQDGNSATFKDLIEDMNGLYLLAAFGILAVIMICDVLKYTLLNRTFGCKIGILKDAKLGLTGKYYESITPTATGGQPMQILYLHKNGVSGGKSTSVVMVKYAVQMLAAAIVGAVVMGVWGYRLFSVIEDGTMSNGIYIGGWVGFCINACAPVFVTFVIFCPRFLKWLINGGLFILSKIRLLKRYEERRDRIFRGIDDFAVCSQFIFTHPGKFFELLGLCLVDPICINIIPYFVLMTFCGGQIVNTPEMFFTVMALSTFATFAVVYIPTPGNSGAFETVFMLAFASISGDAMFWIAIICRFFSYYVYVLLGLGMNGYDLVKSIIAKKKIRLPQIPEETTANPKPDIKIFVSCHKPVEVVKNGIINPVQVGVALKGERLDGMAYYDNDAEDNISESNRRYCELTAQYYVYKNVEADYYGFMHYRRYFSFSEKRSGMIVYPAKEINDSFVGNYGLDENSITSLTEKYDFIMPKAHWIFITNRFMYKIAPTGFVKDLDFCLGIIRRDYPEMYKAAKKYMRSSKSYTCNMFIMKKELFLNYSEWLFDILGKFDAATDISGYTPEQARVDGYLGERLLGIYFSYIKSLKKYKVKTLSRVFIRNTALKTD